MDLSYSESQQMLKSSAREFLAQECPPSLVRAMEEDERGYTAELWQKMVDLGWPGLAFPEQYGGLGGDFRDLCVLLEEMGRFLVPGPFFAAVVLGGTTLLDAGSDEQKQRVLPSLTHGELLLTLAYTEPSATYQPGGIHLKAEASDDQYILNGTKLFVPDAHVADELLVVARTAEGTNPREGITLFLVTARDPRIQLAPLRTLAGDKQFEVTFNDVKVPRESVLGAVGQGWPIIQRALQRAATATCAEMLGGAEAVLEMTVEYVKQRVQFGRPVGSFQAVQHHCANMATDVEGSRFITYQAAWKLSVGEPAALEVSMAKAWVSEAYYRVCALAHQCHGAVGFTQEHDLQLYTRRAKAKELAYGDAQFHRELVAQALEV
ncbi:MAG: acyl-CoA dehydrogenase family protein [Dehalococcoidia bacterium]